MKNYRQSCQKKIKPSLLWLMFGLLSLNMTQVALAKAEAFSEQVVKIIAIDDFKLSAQLMTGSATANGVLVLHDCQHSANAFQPLYTAILQQDLFVLALDLRGFGASQSQVYSHQNIRQEAGDIVSYQAQVAALMAHWKTDVYKAYEYLQRAMANSQAISIVTSGCSSNQAIYLAEKANLTSLVMLAPELSYGDKERFKHLADMPIYLLSPKYHPEAMLNAQELFDWSGDKNSVLQITKGNASSYSLLRHQSYLNQHIANWLKSTLSD